MTFRKSITASADQAEPSRRPGKIPSLDGLRTIAVTIVIWGHAGLPRVIFESAGVTIFFFISGFLITTLMRREHERTGRISIGDFYVRRTLRIWPALYVVLAAVVVLSVVGVLVDTVTGGGFSSTALFYTNYWIIFQGRDGLPADMNALWSLAVEEHFYLLFPLLYIALLRWVPRVRNQAFAIGGICVAILLWRSALVLQGSGYDRVYLATDTRADSILLGCLMAVIWNPVFREARWPAGWRGDLLLFGCLVVFWVAEQAPRVVNQTVGFTVQGIALFGVFAAVVMRPERIAGRVLNWRPIAAVGALFSYTLYLVHRPALDLAHTYVTSNLWAAAAVAIAGSLAVCWLLSRFVERRVGGLRRRFSN